MLSYSAASVFVLTCIAATLSHVAADEKAFLYPD